MPPMGVFLAVHITLLVSYFHIFPSFVSFYSPSSPPSFFIFFYLLILIFFLFSFVFLLPFLTFIFLLPFLTFLFLLPFSDFYISSSLFFTFMFTVKMTDLCNGFPVNPRCRILMHDIDS